MVYNLAGAAQILMKLANAYLLGIHLTFGERPVILVGEGTLGEAGRYLQTYVEGGLTWGSFRLGELRPALPSFWRDLIERIDVKRLPDRIGGYNVYHSITCLKPESINELAGLKSTFPDRLNELSDAMFPWFPTAHLDGHTFPNVLFCQPVPEELSHSRDRIASDAVALMGFDACAIQPAVLDNSLFVTGPYSLSEFESVGALALEPKGPGDEIRIPRIVYDLLGYQGLILILKDLRSRASRVSFVKTPVAEYLRRRADARPRTSNSQRFLAFLSDWEESDRELRSIEDMLRTISVERDQNIFPSKCQTATVFYVRVAPITLGPITNLVYRDYIDAETGVANDVSLGTDRQRSVGDYLRDAANAEATLVNLRLQRLVIVLAVFTVLFGALALIATLLTEEQKKWVWERGAKSPTTTQTRPASALQARPAR
jgi:hypothetical protein